jgi:hypothetical protein
MVAWDDGPTYTMLEEQIIALCYMFMMSAGRFVDMLATFKDFN